MVDAEFCLQVEYLLGDLSGTADHQRAAASGEVAHLGGFVKGGTELARPSALLLASQAQQQVEFLAEEVVDLVDVLAEQYEGFGEGAAAGDDLGSAVADRLEKATDRCNRDLRQGDVPRSGAVSGRGH
ncbi:hypothetical protein ESP51_13560 [Agromyces albus]|uniref:Uncharacterized protein n=1 Tax=Agromyces albus TaxID=205332 RepID=A0A4Q2KUT9_9MICO|nr:hypothetical protein ESP51_13560 [Agromyces albus]